ncbi:ABC transporter ATP-binding protein [Amycolatopsis sp. FDAARGOS 1241]|uniref:ABC transporter ATP-binding protein n=1 Tax=Amycolatopsis sp. FDAARGOS 1241 TaxID=2778070 RepID=UPI0019508922|nr:ABC transporter ATP-binding protein [Amycolatopsis sp. FDAARGOS 1241]QRP43492.1 ABC transporter ATP-binding protein [Amycolatopsis sp. FDAARGOS 1241]
MTDPVLRLEDLHTTIDVRDGVVRPVDGVTLELGRGELLGLVGESGSGKTMTALSILRLLPPGGRVASGRILLGGDNIAAMGPAELREVRGKRVGTVFQDPMTSLNPAIPIGRQVSEPLDLHSALSRGELHERAVAMLELVGLPDARKRAGDYPHQLSGGMRQRVMIARALVCEPELLVADEPTTALDVTVQHQILELIDDLRRRLGMAVILVTHDLGVVAGRADRVAVMYAGKIVELTGTRRLFGNPRHPYTEALFEALPENSVESGEKLYSIPGLPPDLREPPTGCRFAPRCRYASAECAETEPELRADAPGHEYACFHPVGEADGDEPAGVVRVREPGVAPAEDTGAVADAPLLEVEGLVKDFPVTTGVFRRRTGTVSAVAGVSFTVAAGETFGLVGESGCGKTTVGRAVVGLDEPTAGRIRIGGTELSSLRGAELRQRRRDTHLVFQDPYASLDPRMRVGAILAEPLEIHGAGTRAQRARRVRELLGEVGLPADAAQRYPHEFSGGQRQRIGLARALALEPKLIVADEPVSALDVSVQAQILNLMNDLRERHGLTYVFISHDLSVVRYLAQRISVMYLGKLVEAGPAAEVHARPRHPYTRGLIDTVPVADPWADRRTGGVSGELPSALSPPSGCRFRTRCPFAQDICAAEEPVLRPFGGGHEAACHFPLDAAREHDATKVYLGENG